VKAFQRSQESTQWRLTLASAQLASIRSSDLDLGYNSALVEHFKFLSEKIGEKCPLFFTLFFTEKASENLKVFQHFFDLFQIFYLKNEKVVKTF
jgi:hypothetical protein